MDSKAIIDRQRQELIEYCQKCRAAITGPAMDALTVRGLESRSLVLLKAADSFGISKATKDALRTALNAREGDHDAIKHGLAALDEMEQAFTGVPRARRISKAGIAAIIKADSSLTNVEIARQIGCTPVTLSTPRWKKFIADIRASNQLLEAERRGEIQRAKGESQKHDHWANPATKD